MKNPNPGAIAFRARFARRLPWRPAAIVAPLAGVAVAVGVIVGLPALFHRLTPWVAARWPGAQVVPLPILWMRLPVPIFGPARYPSPGACVLLLVASVATIVLLWRREGRRLAAPFRLWLVYVLGLLAVSAAFFLFVPDLFPYTMTDIAILYFEMQTGLWIAIPILVGLALAPLTYRSAVALPHVAMLLALEAYSLLFGWVRYVVLLGAVPYLSYVVVADLFFAFGPLMDFVYVSCLYGLYVGLLADRVRRRPEVWR